MKKLFALALAAAFYVHPAFAGHGETVDAKASAHFNATYKGASGIWNITDKYDEVMFFWHDTLMDSYFDKEGNLIGTLHHVDVSTLPADIQMGIHSSYPGYELKTASMLEKPGKSGTYYVTLQQEGKVLILDVTASGEVTIAQSAF